MKPFTKIVYFHQKTPKVLKKGLHNVLFYNNTDCIWYKCNEKYVKAQYKSPYDVASILETTDKHYLNLRFLKDESYYKYHKNYVKISNLKSKEYIKQIISTNNGHIVKKTKTYRIVKFANFLTAAKVVETLSADFVEKETINGINQETLIKSIISKQLSLNK